MGDRTPVVGRNSLGGGKRPIGPQNRASPEGRPGKKRKINKVPRDRKVESD